MAWQRLRQLASSTNVALLLSILLSCLWVAWGVIEMFHEGWYTPFEWLYFLLPAGAMLALTLLALRLPRLGAILFAATGIAFAMLILWQYRPGSGRGAGLTLANVASWLPVWVFPIVIGILYYSGRKQMRRPGHYVAAIAAPMLLGFVLTIEPMYRLSQRVDDGYLGERFIQGNGVALHWAPAGPGWNRTGGVSWNEVALYGKGSIGFEGKRFGLSGRCNGVGNWAGFCATAEDMQTANVCLYLDQTGTSLTSTRQDVWRMPTTDEIVRSLVRGGNNAGCTWEGQSGHVWCRIRPDKETPLWDPGRRVIYYWTADSISEGEAYLVVYNGEVWHTSKFTALGSRGYRCVRE